MLRTELETIRDVINKPKSKSYIKTNIYMSCEEAKKFLLAIYNHKIQNISNNIIDLTGDNILIGIGSYRDNDAILENYIFTSRQFTIGDKKMYSLKNLFIYKTEKESCTNDKLLPNHDILENEEIKESP